MIKRRIEQTLAEALKRSPRWHCWPQKRYVVYAGKDTFSLGNGITATSLAGLMSEVLKEH